MIGKYLPLILAFAVVTCALWLDSDTPALDDERIQILMVH